MAEGHKTGVSPRDLPEELVRSELERVLHSPEFRASKRSQEFLRFVVENTLSGHSDILKERTIGIDVFGRPPSYDPSDDATVRVKAGEVRKRLGLYYAGEGRTDECRIELPAGTYVPEFRINEQHNGTPAGIEERPPTHIVAPAELKTNHTKIWMAFILLATTAALILGLYRFKAADTALDEFWSPVLRGSTPVLVCAAYVPVYRLDREPNATGTPKVEDFVQLTDQFVGGGDLLAESRITTMLNKLHRDYHVRIGNEVSFQDMRAGPAILIGYSYTRWRDISRELRFFIDAERRPLMVSDNGQPTKWALPNLSRDLRTGEDYAIVSRLFHPDTEAMLVEVAGITQYGTAAAADLVTNPDLMAEALRGAPKGWQKKNLQLVLHVKVISGTPASPKVVATHFW